MHNPTSMNQQGADVGTQYQSAIFYADELQQRVALEVIDELNREGIWDKPIVTSVEPLGRFYSAETYHKDYYKNHPKDSYCQIVIAPKIAKLQQKFIDKIKTPL
jgi:peptide-methionine (S)-S-oxide reductase